MLDNQIAEKFCILRGVVGSTAHGLSVADGKDDRDEMGVCVEPFHRVAGFRKFEQYIHRTAAIRENRHDAPSMAGDLDLVVYGLRKYLRLALKGSPTVLLILYLPEEKLVTLTERGRRLRALAPSIVSRRAGKAFLGYLEAQRQRLMSERGGMKVHRTELVCRHGYDTKYAMHMLRLGYQGLELMSTGRLTLPMPEPERAWLRSVRLGEVELQEVISKAGELERELRVWCETSPLPETPEEGIVEAFMLDCYRDYWQDALSAASLSEKTEL